MGALELLWQSCYEAGEDYVGTAADIEHAIGWTGEAGALTQALVDAGAPEGFGFLEPVTDRPGGYRVHDLWHHAPEYVSNRRSREQERRREKTCARCGQLYFAADPRSTYCSAACRQGGWRDRKAKGDITEEVTDRNGVLRTANVTVTDRNGSPAPAPTPAPGTQKNGSAELHSAPADRGPQVRTADDPQEPDAARAVDRVVLEFPVVGKGPVTWRLTEALVAEWARLFPGVDVEAEARKALAWIRATPGRRKTTRGMERFLVGWLGRTNDRGVPLRAPVVSRPTDPGAINHAWECPHEPPCTERFRCHQRTRIDQERRRHA